MSENKVVNKRKILYGVSDKMPIIPLILSSLQHMLIAVSVGLALPVAVANAAGLDVTLSGSYMAATLFGMGLITLLQSFNGKYLGCGYQSVSTSDSAAIGCCTMAAEAGGIPLVIGLSIFAGLFKFALGHFAYRLRKLFPPEATGTLILVVGIGLVPTAFKYFLGTSGNYGYTGILVAAATFIVMLVCALFIKPLKPYTALVGIGVGYVLSLITGIFDLSAFEELKQASVIALPIYKDLHISFSWELIAPFAIVALASFIDNIGDFTGTQFAAHPDMQKPDWKSIERGIRSSGLGNAVTALFGGTLESTATANIGVTRASGVVSRQVAYVTAGLLMAIAFFPGLTGILSMIPKPVLGAVIMYSMCYIMAGGFITIQSREIDDKRTFSVFLTLGAAISTLIPGLYDFLPQNIQNILISPMVMGCCVLIITTLLSKIGTKRRYSFSTGVEASEVRELGNQIDEVCKKWGTERIVSRKLQIAVNGLCEGLYELNPQSLLKFQIAYDELQIKVEMTAEEPDGKRTGFQSITSGKEIITAEADSQKEPNTANILGVTLKMLENMFDHVIIEHKEDKLIVKVDEDL